ncbi:MAG: hypothetical protein ABW095_12980, partial [Candidatus Thiodiazotropha sp.]
QPSPAPTRIPLRSIRVTRPPPILQPKITRRPVARVQRSVTRETTLTCTHPGFAALHPGYNGLYNQPFSL